jgi:hypothetical protein
LTNTSHIMHACKRRANTSMQHFVSVTRPTYAYHPLPFHPNPPDSKTQRLMLDFMHAIAFDARLTSLNAPYSIASKLYQTHACFY